MFQWLTAVLFHFTDPFVPKHLSVVNIKEKFPLIRLVFNELGMKSFFYVWHQLCGENANFLLILLNCGKNDSVEVILNTNTITWTSKESNMDNVLSPIVCLWRSQFESWTSWLPINILKEIRQTNVNLKYGMFGGRCRS